ncbi:odorant receptor 82a-like [Anopheles stephensi]|uniref:odorant receptor 82a-like n=1 Tax=Anopheles stephensi TaxID=30069 RepID=UPI00165883C3|nr:odorant receptor 82a-like [Anopheles stephensi]
MWYLRYCGVFREKSTLGGMRLSVCLGVLVVFMVLQSIYIFQHVNHFAMICDAIPTLVVCMVAISKFYIFVFRPAAMFALIDSFKALQRRATAHDLLLFRRSGKFHAQLTKIYMTSALIVGWFYILSAVATGISRSLSEGRVQFVAPMAYVYRAGRKTSEQISIFPHNYQHPLMFALTFLFNCDSIHMSIFISGSVDTCFSELATSVTIHFRLIQRRFRALDFTAGADEAELEAVVAYHKDVLQLCLAMTNLFQYTVFYLLLLDSVLLCVIGYQFVIFMNTPRVLMLASMAFVMVLQAVIYCYHGSMMYDESLKVADAIYQSNWYEARPAVQKRLRLCMMRAQKPIVTKGGFMKATLPTLKKILNSTGSYITMLLSLETEQQQ